MGGFKKEIFVGFRVFKSELVQSVQFIGNKIPAIKKENIELKAQNNSLKNSVSDLQNQLRELEQYTRRQNIKVSGIPMTLRVDIIEVVTDVGKVFGSLCRIITLSQHIGYRPLGRIKPHPSS